MAFPSAAAAGQVRIALLVKNAQPSELFQLFLVRHESPPPVHPLVDVAVWDLPSVPVALLPRGGRALCPDDDQHLMKAVSNVKFNFECLGLKGFDVHAAVAQIQALVYPTGGPCKSWRYWKYIEEPEFGPFSPVRTIIFITETYTDDGSFAADGQWVDPYQAYTMLVNADPKQKRIGPMAMFAFSPYFPAGSSFKYDLNIHGQEYPPGVFVAPMDSATLRPFTKTNLVVMAPTAPLQHPVDTSMAVACGDALICDPGCYPAAAQTQLARIVNELPKKLLIFITHHHHDHIEGLPTVKQNNPQAIIIAHEKTLQRMGKDYGLDCIAVTGGSKLLISGQELEIISAPGHTDGHLGLFHRATGTLLVGDHCVGHGSSVLDAASGGNLEDYLATCQRFLELSPKVIIPAHGYPTLWPKHMLQNYIRHREAREAKILSVIQSGARTAYQVVSQAYQDTPAAYWPAALMNVKLHINHLKSLNQIPSDFDVEEFERSSKAPFILRCLPAAASHMLQKPLLSVMGTSLAGSLSVIVVVGAVACLWTKKK
ncbi:hypothetical protein KC19_2G055600 [Ceratodon purpureus]|uniref:Metallo-beta-lactamase domain-containing protein n=1 Tax=Ceratodon purpureus TaxID=3225 RepID=A0A8T0IS64_CERPU|nr:hypothetical protein KC19_2G055600 [Ceratodon purpureus]